jgi:hypothetical protein
MTALPNALSLPAGAARRIAADARAHGLTDVETGGFLMAPRGRDAVRIVAFAGVTGVVRRRRLFQISAGAIDKLFEHADQNELWIPAQFHSHGGTAFLSPTDKRHGLAVEGFVSVVVPFYAAPSDNPSSWGWWQYRAGEWVPTRAAGASLADSAYLRFDEDGVRVG